MKFTDELARAQLHRIEAALQALAALIEQGTVADVRSVRTTIDELTALADCAEDVRERLDRMLAA